MDSLATGFRNRYLDVLASIYLYNEHRGYTALDRVLAAVRARCRDDRGFIAEVEKHRADERKHYVMFRRWFELQGRMPLAIGRAYGHIDHFIEMVFGCRIDDLDTEEVIADGDAFERLCRVIMLTEQRGYAQVEILLRSPIVLSDPAMTRIFKVVHVDEPDHFLPYRHWLEAHGREPRPRWNERFSDFCIHKLLMLVKLPMLFLDSGAARLERWPDEGESSLAAPQP